MSKSGTWARTGTKTFHKSESEPYRYRNSDTSCMVPQHNTERNIPRTMPCRTELFPDPLSPISSMMFTLGLGSLANKSRADRGFLRQISQFSPVLRIHDILVWIRIWIRGSCIWLLDPDQNADPDPAIFVIDLQDAKYLLILKKGVLLITFRRCTTSFFKDKKAQRRHKAVGVKVFLTIFAWWYIPLTDLSGSGSREAQKIWIRNTDFRNLFMFDGCWWSLYNLFPSLLYVSSYVPYVPVFRIRIRIHRSHMFLGLPDPDQLVRGMDPDPAPVPDPSIIMQK